LAEISDTLLLYQKIADMTGYLQDADTTEFRTASDGLYQAIDGDLDNPDLALSLLQDSLDVKLNRSEMDLAPSLIQDSLDVKLNRSEYSPSGFDTTYIYIVTDSLAADIAELESASGLDSANVASLISDSLGTYWLTPTTTGDMIVSDDGSTWTTVTTDIQLDEISDTLLLYQKIADMSGYLVDADTTEFRTASDGLYQAIDSDLDNPDIALNLLQDSLTVKLNRNEMDLAPSLIQDSLDVKANRSELGTGAYATIADYFTVASAQTKADTLCYNWAYVDTVTTGDMVGYKVESNITIVQVAAYTDANTVTFNIEERVATTPNTAGTDAMAADLVADNDQQTQTSFDNADFTKGTWICPTISATDDVARFSITVWYIKQPY
jgi:hypothetical protein